MATVITMNLRAERHRVDGDADHTETMLRDPAEYGFAPDEVRALTGEELRRGVTKQQLIRYGEWLYAKAIRNRRSRALVD